MQQLKALDTQSIWVEFQHQQGNNHLTIQFQELQCPLLALTGTAHT